MQTAYILEAEFIDNQTIHINEPFHYQNKNIIITIQTSAPQETIPKKTFSFGCLKNKVTLSSDFNAPLHDLKEYME